MCNNKALPLVVFYQRMLTFRVFVLVPFIYVNCDLLQTIHTDTETVKNVFLAVRHMHHMRTDSSTELP